jgi:hypothetical protein
MAASKGITCFINMRPLRKVKGDGICVRLLNLGEAP